MPPNLKCCAPVVVDSDSDSQAGDDDHPVTTADSVASNSSSKRARKATSKAAAASDPFCRITEEDKAKKQAAEVRRLKSQLKALQKQLKTQKPATSDNISEDEEAGIQSDPDRLPLESEEENEVELDLSASIRRISTVMQKPVKPVDKPRIRRHEGSLPPERQLRHHTSGSTGGHPGSDMNGNTGTESSLAVHLNNGPVVSNGPPGGGPAHVSQTLPTSSATPSRSGSSPATDRTRAQTSSPTPTATVAPTTGSTSIQGQTLLPAPFRGGVEPPMRARPKAEDYVDNVKDLLLDTVKYFSCYIYTRNAFPSDTQQDTFATDAWNAACSQREESVHYELSDRMKRIIWACKSNARGDVSDDTINKQTGKPEGFAGHPYISRSTSHHAQVKFFESDFASTYKGHIEDLKA
ncbi:hypothetical protein V8D89_009853 [Ganoderma adspersum]